MKFKYFIKDHDETLEDAIELEAEETKLLSEGNGRSWAFEMMAEQAAKHIFYDCDGWDWMWGDGIDNLVIVADGEEREFSIELESEPCFYVCPSGKPR